MCDGKGVVPASWSAFSNPKVKNQPKSIRLKDGRTIIGKVESRFGSTVYVRTPDGKQIELQAENIVSGLDK